jgi:hypothetical protein
MITNDSEPVIIRGVDKAPNVEEILFNKFRSKVEETVDQVMEITARGNISTAIGDSFFGINHRQQSGIIPINKDVYGYTFFTRPRLNLTEENIYSERMLTPLLTKESQSLQRIIRLTLDTEISRGLLERSNVLDKNVTCPFVDPLQAFIPTLTNNIMSMSGWPDMRVETFTSQNGIFNETYSFIDNYVKFLGSFDITANFRNLPGDPITAMFTSWIIAASAYYMGTMVPYPDDTLQNEINYTTRIYRLVMDADKHRVQKIAATGAAFPYSVPMGSSFDYEVDKHLNQSNESVAINFKCTGAIYNDPILIDEFNRTVIMFNNNMGDEYRARTMVKVPLPALAAFNNRGYARIDPMSFELEWYVSAQEFKERMPIYYRTLDPTKEVLKGNNV